MAIFGDNNFVKKIKIEEDEKIIPTNDAYINYSGRYHINCVSGDDNNDGLTTSTAWKTLDKLFELFNYGMTDVRCYLDVDGVYNLSKNNLNGVTIHITASSQNVTINYDFDDKGATFYNCHLNYKGVDSDHPLKITTNSNYSEIMVIENCQTAFTNVSIDKFKYVEFYGGGSINENCVFPGVWTDTHNASFNNTSITHLEVNVGFVIRNSSIVSIRGNLSFTNRTTSYNLINVERSILMLYPVTFLSTTRVTNGKSIQSRTGTIYATTDIINAIDSLATTSHDFSAISVWYKTNTTLPS